jgi:hypothetical protein
MLCYFYSTIWQFIADTTEQTCKLTAADVMKISKLSGVPRGIRTPVTAVKGRRTFLVTQPLTAPCVLFLSFLASPVSHSSLTGHYLEQGKTTMHPGMILAWSLVGLVAVSVALFVLLLRWLDRRYLQDAVQCDECGRDHARDRRCVCGAL